jgi:hypothetical protein
VTQRQKQAAEMHAAGEDYATIQQSLGVRARWVRRLLQQAGIRRRSGRPRTRPMGRRVSFIAAGLA